MMVAGKVVMKLCSGLRQAQIRTYVRTNRLRARAKAKTMANAVPAGVRAPDVAIGDYFRPRARVRKRPTQRRQSVGHGHAGNQTHEGGVHEEGGALRRPPYLTVRQSRPRPCWQSKQ